MANNIVTIEQDELIKEILHRKRFEMTYEQYGQILTLADEVGKFDEYIRKAGRALSYDEAELLKDELINEILERHAEKQPPCDC